MSSEGERDCHSRGHNCQGHTHDGDDIVGDSDGGHSNTSHGHECHHGHGHSHGHEGGGHDCQHEHNELESGIQERWLFDSIDTVNVKALNAKSGHGPLDAIKPYDLRMDVSRWMESDADEQLIVNIPFTGSVKLKAFSLASGRISCLISSVFIVSQGAVMKVQNL
mmetsp:Transcript_9657/g.27754  ORF Transcript_9657/g.27754 Transcript_9657/m.27754 type:complete len:165 (-) Transcript_9657:542-1036(-)